MKLRLIFLAVSAIITTAAPANACDGVSFFRYANGRCVNLTSMTWLGRAEAKQAGLEREKSPIQIKIGDPEPIDGERDWYQVRIDIKNISANTTLKRSFFYVDNIGSKKLILDDFGWTELAPGETQPIFARVYWPGNTKDLKPENFKVKYNPRKSRDMEGIGRIVKDRDEALDRSYPYNIKKEVTVCLVDYCPRGMARTDR
jgi:hypothetical protein